MDGKIADVGTTSDLAAKYKDAKFEKDIDGQNKISVMPGLIDTHTHPVWAGDRVHEFSMKLKGATYMDIHAQGGGIGFSVGSSHSLS